MNSAYETHVSRQYARDVYPRGAATPQGSLGTSIDSLLLLLRLTLFNEYFKKPNLNRFKQLLRSDEVCTSHSSDMKYHWIFGYR